MYSKLRTPSCVLQAADDEVRRLALDYANDSAALTEVWRLLNSQGGPEPTLLDLRWQNESGQIVLLEDLKGWASTR